MRKSKTQPLKEVIQDYLKAIRVDDKLLEVRLIKEWYNLSRAIAYSTANAYVSNRKLYVKLNSPTLKNELSFRRAQIVETLNENVQHSVIEDVILL